MLFRRQYHKAQSPDPNISNQNYYQSGSTADSWGIIYPSRTEQIRAYTLLMDTVNFLDMREREKLQIKKKIDDFLNNHSEMLFDNCS